MYFVVAGVLLLVMKWAEFGPAAAWSWGWILAPFALAIAWWAWADSSGYTQRKAAEKDQERKDDAAGEEHGIPGPERPQAPALNLVCPRHLQTSSISS